MSSPDVVLALPAHRLAAALAVVMWAPAICNCLIWALWMVVRHGGAIKGVKSHYGWWPHFLWESETGETWEYVPPERVRLHGWQQVLPIRILLFRGVVKLAGRYEEVG